MPKQHTTVPWHLLGRIVLVAFLAAIAALGPPVYASPRISGRLVKVLPQKRTVVFQRSDGKVLRAVLRKDATVKRMGAASSIASFKVGEYIVVEVAGALNDSPLDGGALLDVQTAGKAPPPPGSAPYYTQQGGFATVWGPAAPMPNSPNVYGPVGIGGSQNVQKANIGVWRPTRPWPGIGTEPGQSLPPVVDTWEMQNREAAPQQQIPQAAGQPNVYAYGPNAGASTTSTSTTSTIKIPPSGSAPNMNAAPAPANSPWVAEAVSHNRNQRSSTPSDSPAPPPPSNAPPTTSSSPYQRPVSAPSSIPPEISSIQGNVTQIVMERRVFYVQSLVQGRPTIVTVVVPPQVQLLSARTQQLLGLETLRTGDFVMIQGFAGPANSVEARKIFVNP